MLGGTCTPLSTSHTSLLATCTFTPSGQVVYSNILLYLPTQPANLLPRQGRYSITYTQDSTSTSSTSSFSRYSIALVILDALSQLNVYRSLPAALAAVEGLGGVLYRGHHKVLLLPSRPRRDLQQFGAQIELSRA